MPCRLILKAAAHPDGKYRNAAINMSSSIEDPEVVKKWISYFPKATTEAKPEIITMLGNTGSKEAQDLIESALRLQ